MEPATLEALKASIAKWERNVEATLSYDVEIGWRSCPLCMIFNNPPSSKSRCRGCPVYGATGKIWCEESPFEAVDEILQEWQDEGLEEQASDFRAAAQAEVDFLKSLLPAEA